MFKESSNSKPRPLSSQPKRSWGDVGGEGEESKSTTTTTNKSKSSSISSSKKEFTLTEEDWPPSPPPKRKYPTSTTNTTLTSSKVSSSSNSFSNSISSKSASTIARPPPISSSFSSNVGRPLVPKNSFSSKPNASTTGLAAMFKPPMKVSTSSSSSSSNNNNNKSRSTGTSSSSKVTSGSESTSNSSTSSTIQPISRAKPWDLASTSSIAPNRPSSNFHNLPSNSSKASGSGSGIKRDMLSSNTMTIAQKVSLSPEQQMVLKLVVNDGKNVFFTGSAGTGKSVLLREIIAALKIKHRASDAVAVTASTGMAACNIRGTTIHSFAGIGIGAEDAEALISKVRKNRIASGKWQRVKVLVVDEISMVDGILFDKLAAIAKALKKNNLPFGGIQLVVTGDFFQLPPVTKSAQPVFAFEVKAWSQVIHHTVNLTQVFRQKDTTFIDMLNEMRFGQLSDDSCRKFAALSREPTYDDGVEPTELFPRREEVERANLRRLQALTGEMQIYKSEDYDKQSYQGKPSTLIQSFMAVERLELKIGAQVMVIKNLDADLVNGSVGKVIGFGYDAQMDSEDETEPDKKKLKLAAEVGAGRLEMAPRVEFKIHGGEIRQVLMKREEWSVEDSSRITIASRKQYPLILAWAMSIHKSQGQTIPRVKVDLGKVFEKGQSYVALSRAVSLDGLQVLGFNKTKVNAHPKVIAWSKTLETLR